MKIHLVYPYNPDKIAAPWSIGNNLTIALKKKGFAVINYDWDSSVDILPYPDDILIGHPHPDREKTFTRNLERNFRRKIVLCPWNGLEDWRWQLQHSVEYSDNAFLFVRNIGRSACPRLGNGKQPA